MSKQDRQKLSILVVLIGVLALTVVLGFRMNQPPTTAAVQPSVQKTSANPPAANDARILLDLVEKSGGTDGNIGKRNLFQYQQAPPPPVSASDAACGTTTTATDRFEVPGLRSDSGAKPWIHGFSF